MFVTAEDFDLEPYNIPNLVGNNSFIEIADREERKLLKRILGLTFYNALNEAIQIDPIPDRFKNIVDGKEYKFLGEDYEWAGMVEMLKGFIYSRWTRYLYLNNSGIGINVSDGENSTNASPALDITYGYNRMCDSAGYRRNQKNSLYGYLFANSEDFDDLIDTQVYPNFKVYLQRKYDVPTKLNVFNL